MTRAQVTLVATLVAQLLLLAVLLLRGGDTAATAAHALLPAMKTIAPARVEIREGKDKAVEIAKTDAGWVLSSPQGYPADAKKVDTLVATLRDIEVRAPVVSGSRYHAALHVTDDAYDRRVRVWDAAGGDAKVDLLVGTSSGFQATNVRAAGNDAVYEARSLRAYDMRADASAWVDSDFVSVPIADVTGIKLKNREGEIDLVRGGSGWQLTAPAPPRGRTLDAAKAEALVRSVTTLRLADPAAAASDPSYGLADPVARVEIAYRVHPQEGKDEPRTITVLLGTEVPASGGKRYATKLGEAHAATLSKYDAEEIAGKKLADLLQAPPAPPPHS